jgi:hypothetical protein
MSIKKCILVQWNLTKNEEIDHKNLASKKLYDELLKLSCRWCSKKVEISNIHGDKVKCSWCGWLLWKIDYGTLDYKFINGVPNMFMIYLNIDAMWVDMKEYYIRRTWGNFNYTMLESTHLEPNIHMEKEEKFLNFFNYEWKALKFY